MNLFKTLAIGFIIYTVWKIAEGFFRTSKVKKQQEPPKPKNQDKDGFTDYEEVD